MADETKRCPFCAEEILAAAIKCKQCGEMLETPSKSPQATKPKATGGEHRCPHCFAGFTKLMDMQSHVSAVHRGSSSSAPKPPVRNDVPTKKQKISEVGIKSDAGLHCPKCGGTNFKVKRSAARKVAAPIAAAFVLRKATQVKCVTCGTVFKRG